VLAGELVGRMEKLSDCGRLGERRAAAAAAEAKGIAWGQVPANQLAERGRSGQVDGLRGSQC